MNLGLQDIRNNVRREERHQHKRHHKEGPQRINQPNVFPLPLSHAQSRHDENSAEETCNKNNAHAPREGVLYDEGTRIQVEIHSQESFSLRACFVQREKSIEPRIHYSHFHVFREFRRIASVHPRVSVPCKNTLSIDLFRPRLAKKPYAVVH